MLARHASAELQKVGSRLTGGGTCRDRGREAPAGPRLRRLDVERGLAPNQRPRNPRYCTSCRSFHADYLNCKAELVGEVLELLKAHRLKLLHVLCRNSRLGLRRRLTALRGSPGVLIKQPALGQLDMSQGECD